MFNFFVGLFFGGLFGIVIMSLFVAAGDEDRWL